MTKIRREPILINNHAVAIIHIFDRLDHLEDLWTADSDAFQEEKLEMYKEAATQFISQLEEQWTPSFMMALRDGINNELKEHDIKYGTKFSK